MTHTTEVTTSQQTSGEQARGYELAMTIVFQSTSHTNTTMKLSADCEELFWGQADSAKDGNEMGDLQTRMSLI